MTNGIALKWKHWKIIMFFFIIIISSHSIHLYICTHKSGIHQHHPFSLPPLFAINNFMLYTSFCDYSVHISSHSFVSFTFQYHYQNLLSFIMIFHYYIFSYLSIWFFIRWFPWGCQTVWEGTKRFFEKLK